MGLEKIWVAGWTAYCCMQVITLGEEKKEKGRGGCISSSGGVDSSDR